MPKNSAKNLMRGALLLSVSALIAKVLSAVYRIPFQNLVGNTGFYVYQQVYPIYGIGMTLALSGLPNFISKLVAEQADIDLRQRLLKRSFVLISILSLGIFSLLYLQAGPIAQLMGDGQLASLIRTVAFMFLLTPFLSVLRGYFQGTFDMRPTAISQVVEQLVRVGVILLAASLFVHHHWSYYKMGTVAMSGAFLGGLIALAVMLPAYCRFKQPSQLSPTIAEQALEQLRYIHLTKRFLLEGGSIALFSATMVIFQLLDSFSVTKGLIESGQTNQLAYNLKGIYDRAQPLVQMGLVVTMAFVTTLLPALSNARQANKKVLFIKVTQQLVHLALVLSAAASVGLIVLMPWINQLLFGDRQGSLTLALYMVSIMLVALINVFSSVLQSLDHFKVATVALLSGFIIKLMFNQIFTRVFGIAGSSFVTIIALGWIAFILFLRTPTYLKQAVFNHNFIFRLLLAVLIMGGVVLLLAVYLQLWLPNNRVGAGITTLVGIFGGILVFLGAMVKLQVLSTREWLALPYVGRLLRHWQTKKHKF
ncbi:putative polysaccharide biosynthesis protein [Agrilactobacillus fermenti]|uniref:putative polysaccharide biosynthesis protein n=1 Tax=Agrilactobacillus fermenti TaxID=2586909 RepID=UPI001E502547|nr:polysaccharide biosynthesis protein [Agrilactobacillus fermenti]MCD2255945.1 polysaccharide biosynthesis protein [Agrilactobacillus fermenti]